MVQLIRKPVQSIYARDQFDFEEVENVYCIE